MKISVCSFFIVLLTGQLLFAGPGYGQGMEDKKITLGLQKESLSNALKKIEDLSGFRIAYTLEDVNKYEAISLHRATRTLEKTLQLVLSNTRLDFRRQNNAIIIYRNQSADAASQFVYETVLPADTTVRGRITNDRNEPVESASILIKGTQNGTYTNAQGDFLLRNVGENATLVISAVGYQEQELVLNGRTTLNAQLISSATGMEEVVVTALGISREAKSLSYTTQKINPTTLTEVRDPNNVLNSLQGKVANALIIQGSEGVGGPAKIILRGNKSLTKNSSALIVVDGIPANMQGINPDNIESMTVLNGATGATLYGPDAGGGVILITTKKGAKGGVKVDVNSGMVLERPFALPSVQNQYGQGGGTGVIDPSSGSNWGPKMEGQAYTDYHGNPAVYSAQPNNINDFFNTGMTFNNAIGISAGSEKAQTYLSYVNNAVEGIIPNNKLMSHIINLRITNQVGERFSTDAKITYHRRQINSVPRYGEGNTPLFDAYKIPRNVTTAMARHYQNINSVGVPVLAPWPTPAAGVYSNPYWIVNNDRHNQTRNSIVGFLRAQYKITDWLSIRGSANIDYYEQLADWRTYEGTVSWAPQAGGRYEVMNTRALQQWFDLMLEGNNKIGKDIKVNYHLGTIYKDYRLETLTNLANGLRIPNNFNLAMATAPQITHGGEQIRTPSVFGLTSISFKDYLFLEGTVRNDWDSRLPSPYNYLYYSFGLSGILSDMFVLPSGINYLKAFVNYSEVGNGGEFGLLTTVNMFIPGVGAGSIGRGAVLPATDLKPEIVKTIEGGIEARFLDNRLGVSLNYYKSNAMNQLFSVPITVATGYSTRYINAGNVQNQGIEVVLNATPVRNAKFGWSVDFNFGMNRNKIIELTDQIKIMNQGIINWGAQPRVMVGGSFGDLYSKTWLKNDKGQYIVDDLGRPMTSDRMNRPDSFIGNFQPKARVGLSNSFTYGHFALRILVDGRIGGIAVSGTEMNLAHNGVTEATAAHREGGWVLGGVNADGNPVTQGITAQQFWQIVSSQRNGVGEFFTYDATSFRVRELSLGYDFPVKAKMIKTARLSAVARNLFWIYRGSSKLDIPGLSKRKMWMDPDIGSIGNNQVGNEYGLMPSTRSVGLNLQLTF
ncbi:MAG: SusC/RagA family TonB-linked outer membrane protein [Chitinophagaceae bacterium]|nr:SusC/RagA family TonB-linked outer membrane protein [Chitinophagaceae bacterium]